MKWTEVLLLGPQSGRVTDTRSNAFWSRVSNQELIFIAIESDDYFIAQDESRRRQAVKFFGQDTKIFGIGADVSFLEGNATRNQKFLGLVTRSAAGFGIEMIRHKMSR
jgi:hypothetical protein